MLMFLEFFTAIDQQSHATMYLPFIQQIEIAVLYIICKYILYVPTYITYIYERDNFIQPLALSKRGATKLNTKNPEKHKTA